MSYVPRKPDTEAMEACRRFMRWVKGKTAAQIRDRYLKGAPPDGTVVAELAHWSAEAERLRAETLDLKRRIRLARREMLARGWGEEAPTVLLLDLRKPLPRKGARTCRESSLVAWGAHLLKRKRSRR